MTPADQPTRACNICGRTDGGHDSAPDDFVSLAARERWAAGPGGRIAALETGVERLRSALQDIHTVAFRFTREADLELDERLARALQDLSVIRRSASRALDEGSQ